MNLTVHSKGHWFCDYCDDVVFMSYENRKSVNVPCPVCGRLACNFIPEKISSKILPSHWFAAMRRAVDQATTPELHDQRAHKEIL
jgi:hypothetical protein